ncbi:MAG: DUF4235 domain-containing protein [Nocardioidaceae bacterium]
MASSKVSNAVTLVAALGATAAAKRVADATWKLGAGKKPPTDPTDPETAAREAMLWAVLSGALVGVVRTWVNRRLAKTQRERRALAEGVTQK